MRLFQRPAFLLALGAATAGAAFAPPSSQLAFYHGLRDHPLDKIVSETVVAGDVNNDGNMDLVVTGNVGVAVLFGNGKGGFLPGPVSGPIGQNWPFLLEDFTGDGRLDIIATGVGSVFDLVLMVGDGKGGFGAPKAMQVSGGLIESGDFNEDGKPDLLDGSGNVLLNAGAGAFTLAGRLPSPSQPSVIGDLNGDGHLDVVGIYDNASVGQLTVSLGRGDGTFQPPVTSPSSLLQTPTPRLGDFNHDGIPDLVAFDRNVPSFTVFLGQGDGTFRESSTTTLSPAANVLLTADLDGDGITDIVTAADGMTQIRRGLGNGTFSVKPGPSISGTYAFDIITADLNSDGSPDVVINTGWTTVSVLLGYGDGTFREPPSFPLPPGGSVAADGDFNHDGVNDFAVANLQQQSVSVFFTDAGGGLSHGPASPANGVIDIYAGDFNRDGTLDLLNVTAQGVGVLLGRGDGTFASSPQRSVPLAPIGAATLMDFNGDGKLDILIPHLGRRQFVLFAGNGDGTLQPAKVLEFSGINIRAATAADFDGDKIPDIVAVANGWLRFFKGNGDGSFQPPVLIMKFTPTSELFATDVNRDGHMDIVTSEIKIFPGNGDGTFQRPLEYPGGTGSGRSFHLADLNQDGIPDLFFVDHDELGFNPSVEGDNVGVLLGKGDGSFFSTRFFAAGRAPVLVTPIRFNTDGKPDLAVVNKDSNSVTLLINVTGETAAE